MGQPLQSSHEGVLLLVSQHSVGEETQAWLGGGGSASLLLCLRGRHLLDGRVIIQMQVSGSLTTGEEPCPGWGVHLLWGV